MSIQHGEVTSVNYSEVIEDETMAEARKYVAGREGLARAVLDAEAYAAHIEKQAMLVALVCRGCGITVEMWRQGIQECEAAFDRHLAASPEGDE